MLWIRHRFQVLCIDFLKNWEIEKLGIWASQNERCPRPSQEKSMLPKHASREPSRGAAKGTRTCPVPEYSSRQARYPCCSVLKVNTLSEYCLTSWRKYSFCLQNVLLKLWVQCKPNQIYFPLWVQDPQIGNPKRCDPHVSVYVRTNIDRNILTVVYMYVWQNILKKIRSCGTSRNTRNIQKTPREHKRTIRNTANIQKNSQEHRGTQKNSHEHHETQKQPGSPRNTKEQPGIPQNTKEQPGTPQNTDESKKCTPCPCGRRRGG